MKAPAPRNCTLQLSETERSHYCQKLIQLTELVEPATLLGRTVCQNLFEVLDYLPTGFVDLLFVDPPYNLSKRFNQQIVRRRSLSDYEIWVSSWLSRLIPTLKPTLQSIPVATGNLPPLFTPLPPNI